MTKKAILFDLDGTLADTAPDLIDALNRLLKEQGKQTVKYEDARCHASRGARGIISFGLGMKSPEIEKIDGYQALIERFLELYSQRLYDKTVLFPNVSKTLKQLSQRDVAWGIVTNKRQAFAEPILKHFEIDAGAACLVYGDTTGVLKPSPKPLFYAAEKINALPNSCIYVGDNKSDVQAAKAAGMTPAIVSYGYEISPDSGKEWNVDIILNDINDIIQYI